MARPGLVLQSPAIMCVNLTSSFFWLVARSQGLLAVHRANSHAQPQNLWAQPCPSPGCIQLCLPGLACGIPGQVLGLLPPALQGLSRGLSLWCPVASFPCAFIWSSVSGVLTSHSEDQAPPGPALKTSPPVSFMTGLQALTQGFNTWNQGTQFGLTRLFGFPSSVRYPPLARSGAHS